MSTPRKPTLTAAQRRGPTRSPSSGIDSAVTSSGAAKPIAVASAIGSRAKPAMNSSAAPRTVTPRSSCSRSRAVARARGSRKTSGASMARMAR